MGYGAFFDLSGKELKFFILFFESADCPVYPVEEVRPIFSDTA